MNGNGDGGVGAGGVGGEETSAGTLPPGPPSVTYNFPDPSGGVTDFEQFMMDYIKGEVEKGPWEPPEPTPEEAALQAETQELMRQWIAYQKDQLTWLQDARDLGEISGDLTPEEITLLDDLEASAISEITTQVQDALEETMGTEMARLTASGVLQGGIGEETLARLGEKAAKAIASGVGEVERSRMTSELGMRESTKDRNLRIQEMVQTGVLTREQGMSQMAMGMWGEEQTQSRFEQEMGFQASQFAPGLALGAWGVSSGARESAANRALQMTIANMEARAARRAGKYQAIGTIGGMAAAAGIMASSKEFKTDIMKLDDSEQKEMLDKVKNINIYNYRYRDENPESKKHMGIITEESPQEIVTRDGKALDTISYLGYLITCVKVLANKVEKLEKLNASISST